MRAQRLYKGQSKIAIGKRSLAAEQKKGKGVLRILRAQRLYEEQSRDSNRKGVQKNENERMTNISLLITVKLKLEQVKTGWLPQLTELAKP